MYDKSLRPEGFLMFLKEALLLTKAAFIWSKIQLQKKFKINKEICVL